MFFDISKIAHFASNFLYNKSITVNLGDSVNETIFQDMLAKTGNTFYPHTVFGYSHNAINHYNNYKKQYKQTKQQNKG